MFRSPSSIDLKQLSSLRYEQAIAQSKLANETDVSVKLHITNALVYMRTRIKEIEDLFNA